jgi:membrane-associated phospholipid phosphatase
MISTDTSANVIQGAPAPQDQIGREAALRGPRAVALAWLSVYLAAAGAVLGAGGHGWLVGVHIAVIAVALLTISPKGSASRTIGDLLPLVAAPLLYAEVPMLIAVLGSAYHDVLVQGWEQAVFGTQPARSLAGRFPFVAMSELLHAGYLGYYLVIFAPPLLLLAKGQRRGFAETVLALTVTCTLCWTIFALFPVEGPRYLWAAPLSVPNGPMRRLVVHILAAGSSRGAAFPSSHMAVSTAQAVMAWRWQRGMGWVLASAALLIGCGAVYGGFHYGVDMLAGAAVGGLVSSCVVVVFERHARL